MAAQLQRGYKPTEAKYKHGAAQMYVTYDLPQKTRGESPALYPKVKRVYIAGNVKDWQVGTFAKRTGKTVRGVKIEYEQSRTSYQRKGYTATRGGTPYAIAPAQVRGTTSIFSKIVEVPEKAQHVMLHIETLPAKYGAALQDIR